MSKPIIKDPKKIKVFMDAFLFCNSIFGSVERVKEYKHKMHSNLLRFLLRKPALIKNNYTLADAMLSHAPIFPKDWE